MLFTILLLAACGLTAWIVYVRININKMAKFSEKLPGPKTIPFVGNAKDLGGLNPNAQPKDFFDAVVQELTKKYGSLFRIWVGPNLFIIMSDPKCIEVILSSNTQIDKGSNYKYTLPWIGNGLLTSTGPTWKKHRRIITPTFHFKILEDFVEIFNFNGQKMINKLKEKVNGTELDIHPYVSLCALDIIAETAMGISINAQDNDESDFVKATRNMARIIVWRSFKPWLQWNLLMHLLPTGKLQRDSLKVLHALSSQVIRSRKEKYLKDSKTSTASANGKLPEESDIGAKKRKAFLDMLLEATQDNSILTDDEIREEVDTFMFEGHDTTSSGISFTLSSLSLHPEIQERAYQEQQKIFGDSDREATYQDLLEMKYLEQVIKETLRMFPSVPLFVRCLNENVKVVIHFITAVYLPDSKTGLRRDPSRSVLLTCYKFDQHAFLTERETPITVTAFRWTDLWFRITVVWLLTHFSAASGEYTLPKGANIVISPMIIHRSEKYYPNPEMFDPERFSTENSQGRHPYQYIPFSAGPRNCIGQKFAVLEMKATASKMLRNFRLLPGSTTNDFDELSGELVLKNLKGVKMKLVERK